MPKTTFENGIGKSRVENLSPMSAVKAARGAAAARALPDGIRVLRIKQSSVCEIPAHAAAEHIVSLHLDGDAEIEKENQTGRFDRQKLTAGDICICPADSETGGHSQTGFETVFVHFAPATLAQTAGEAADIDRFEIVPQLKMRDRLAAELILNLCRETEDGGAFNRLYVESLGNTLALHLLAKYCRAKSDFQEYKGGLAPAKLKRVVEFIRENLTEDLSLAQIADVAGLNQFHFARQFKQSCGIAPHRYVVRERVEIAKRLLRETDLPLVEVCFASGFQNQSHFTKIFSRIAGATPKNFRDRS